MTTPTGWYPDPSCAPEMAAPGMADLARWDASEIAAVAATLNARPRKVLGWKTPAEVFDELLLSAQQAGVATTD